MKICALKLNKIGLFLLGNCLISVLIATDVAAPKIPTAPPAKTLPSPNDLPKYTPPAPPTPTKQVSPPVSTNISAEPKSFMSTPASTVSHSSTANNVSTNASKTSAQGPFNGEKIITKKIDLNEGHSNPEFKQKVNKAWEDMSSGDPRSFVRVEGRSVLVKGTEQEVIDLENYIALLDKPVTQVRVDAIILFATRNYNFDIGIDWSGIYNRAQSVMANGNPFGFVGLGGSLNEIPTPTSPAGTAYLSSGGAPSLGTSPDNNLLVDPTNFALNLFNKAFTPTTAVSAGQAFVRIPFVFGGADLNLRRLNLVLNAAENESKVKIVSRPSVLTGDGQTATVNIGQQLPMQQSALNGSTGTIYKSGQIVYKSVGISLTVTPIVGKDNKTITLKIEISNLEFISGSTQSNNDGIMTNPPVISDLSVTNNVVLKSGQTTVIGGLATRSDRKTTNRVPLLYRVPVLGNLFQASLNSDSELEQFIFITPTIIEENL